ncbi:unnamed protein product [Acanthosepion pharaonis]|uniref:Uncharacterized protein n=1 Tax=Acanthosepion pharaonis TaxID=158019 RepID=A0A812DL51_ACAPH|nr:unnamed protein product [Sepia pharaonis]
MDKTHHCRHPVILLSLHRSKKEAMRCVFISFPDDLHQSLFLDFFSLSDCNEFTQKTSRIVSPSPSLSPFLSLSSPSLSLSLSLSMFHTDKRNASQKFIVRISRFACFSSSFLSFFLQSDFLSPFRKNLRIHLDVFIEITTRLSVTQTHNLFS